MKCRDRAGRRPPCSARPSGIVLARPDLNSIGLDLLRSYVAAVDTINQDESPAMVGYVMRNLALYAARAEVPMQRARVLAGRITLSSRNMQLVLII